MYLQYVMCVQSVHIPSLPIPSLLFEMLKSIKSNPRRGPILPRYVSNLTDGLSNLENRTAVFPLPFPLPARPSYLIFNVRRLR